MLLLAVHLAATAAMVGLIWFVQVVHYPLMAAVGTDHFVGYERDHQRLTSLVVGPLMAAEGVTAGWLAFAPPDDVGRVLPVLGLGLLAVIHASTVLLQVPQHTALGAGFDPARHRRLVRTNWIRTLGWTARGVLAVGIVLG